jgi:hypothetical protein
MIPLAPIRAALTEFVKHLLYFEPVSPSLAMIFFLK